MLAARLSAMGTTCARGFMRSSLISTPKSPFMPIVRGYREAGRGFTRRSRTQMQSAQVTESAVKGKIGPMEVGQIAVAGGAVLGMGALCYYGLGMSNEPGAIDRVVVWPQFVRDRIRDTYLYLGASCAATAASAIAVFKSPMGHRFFALCSKHPIASTIGIIVALMGTGQAMMAIPYSPGIGSKQMMWLLNCGILGLAIAPIGALGGALAIRAAWYTAGIVGGLSTVAVCAPSDKFLNWAGPLGIGLGGVFVASLGSAFLPPTSALGLSLYSISLYGGLLLFSAFLLYDTQKVIRKAETHPNMWGVMPYDPINMSHHIVLDVVNIFVRMVQILALGGGRRK
ncbi:growth hormone-inducible transmembrane protein-like [Penaeus japonicus]|uniref:growth hormone-inducible transmembrane protein-like n=1 Tax=Penaeus japonicus TaxID=27405 RepID=UPI001C70DE5C|nr:growth hormone-inducible transmembrane protein-like [Penaeus japonicus]